MENNQKHEIEIDLKQIFGLLLSKALYIGVIGVVCAILAFSFFKFAATEKFTSTTQIRHAPISLISFKKQSVGILIPAA